MNLDKLNNDWRYLCGMLSEANSEITRLEASRAALLAAAKEISGWLDTERQEMLVGKLEAAIAAAEEPAP
jgi:hypothetical protein